jgi:hypothetical protein
MDDFGAAGNSAPRHTLFDSCHLKLTTYAFSELKTGLCLIHLPQLDVRVTA